MATVSATVTADFSTATTDCAASSEHGTANQAKRAKPECTVPELYPATTGQTYSVITVKLSVHCT